MKNDRLSQLLAFHKDDPSDPFTIYAIALEYVEEFPEKAASYFNLLLAQHPDYLPTYYHAAPVFSSLGDQRKASEIYERGIALAQKLGESSALRELKSAFEMHLFENE
jgi:tetratricopeptide (TPR) repeat protein